MHQLLKKMMEKHTHTHRKKQIIKQQNEKYEIGETTTPSLHQSRRSRKR
jgi:hypothetical protein